MSSLTLTTIQSGIHWENIEANLAMFSEKIEALREKTQVIILPEMFSTGFSANVALAETEDGTAFSWMKETSRQKGVVMIGSLMIREDNHFYNRAYCVLPNGNFGTYDKRHLLPLGEEHQFFSPGNKRLICSVNGWKLQLQVCYDLRFPVWARQQLQPAATAEYDVLVNIANWPAKRSDHWQTLLKARAIENQCFTVGVNRIGRDGNDLEYNGGTAVYSPLGETLYKKENEEATFTITLHKNELQNARAALPFLADADHFIIH